MKTLHFILLISLLAGILPVSLGKCNCFMVCLMHGGGGVVKRPGNCVCDCDKELQGRSETERKAMTEAERKKILKKKLLESLTG
ncbi:hypothetical protein CDAR_87991 [Caerostris darwini]|uniref:Uncharacterized protein n=1 Tax=Caerostris darwini TaxID=1538125 RepID=A0AAV4S4D1_9ARAC|nr:hypothetical protein CDAR_87991 [Caerostris darwini]